MTRPMALVDQGDGRDGHPSWCALGHHCTAWLPSGEHSSVPEVWRTDLGRVVATRHRTVGGRGRLEVRYVVELPADERRAVRLMRYLVAAAYVVLSRARRRA